MGSPARGGLESVSRRQLSIHVRVLFLACMCTLLAVTVAVTSYLYRSLLQSNQQEAQSLAEYLSPALEFDDQPAVADYLASLSNSPDVLHARVLRLDGGPSYAEYSAGGPGAATNFYSELFGLAPLTVRADINYRDQRRGQLELSVSLDTVIRTTAVICGFVALTSASFMVLLILTSRRQNRAISNPLESMAELMARVSASGDYQSRAAPSELAEIDDLSRGFNELMARIASREAQIAKLANFDSLTGLRNRRGFLKRVEREIQAAEREGSALLLMYVDVDHFKSVNDSLGHDIGDEVLVDGGGESMHPPVRLASPSALRGGAPHASPDQHVNFGGTTEELGDAEADTATGPDTATGRGGGAALTLWDLLDENTSLQRRMRRRASMTQRPP